MGSARPEFGDRVTGVRLGGVGGWVGALAQSAAAPPAVGAAIGRPDPHAHRRGNAVVVSGEHHGEVPPTISVRVVDWARAHCLLPPGWTPVVTPRPPVRLVAPDVLENGWRSAHIRSESRRSRTFAVQVLVIASTGSVSSGHRPEPLVGAAVRLGHGQVAGSVANALAPDRRRAPGDDHRAALRPRVRLRDHERHGADGARHRRRGRCSRV